MRTIQLESQHYNHQLITLKGKPIFFMCFTKTKFNLKLLNIFLSWFYENIKEFMFIRKAYFVLLIKKNNIDDVLTINYCQLLYLRRRN